jgi:hypothetical protein
MAIPARSKKTVAAIAIITVTLLSAAFITEAGSPGEVTMPAVVAIKSTSDEGEAKDGTDGYKPTSAKGLKQIEEDVTLSGNKFTFTAKDTPDAAVNDSGVIVFYTNPSDTSEKERSATALCTVAELLDISGIIDDTDIFSNLDHYYIGDLSEDFMASDEKDLNLKLKYLPDDLTHGMLPGGWTLEGTPAGGGALTYVKDEAEPKWKGKTNLTKENHGVIEYKAKWDSMEVNKKLTKFSLKLVQVEGDKGRNLYAFQTKNRSTKARFVASILPSGLEDEFSQVKFQWEEQKSGRLTFKFDGKNRKYCTTTPKVYKLSEVSTAKDDTVVKVAWKIPTGVQAPFHTATQPISFTVRTCKEIVEISNNKVAPMPIPRWQVFFKIQDQFKEDISGSVIDGMWVKEKWDPKPWGRKYFVTEGNTKIGAGVLPTPSGQFYDLIGAKYNITLIGGIGTGHQWIYFDHIYSEHDVELNPANEKVIYSDPPIHGEN